MGWLAAIQFAWVVWVVVYLVRNHIHIEKVSPVSGPLDAFPKVSVCVPARNEARDLGACLESLLKQDYPDFEVIVVDDQSTDGTAEVIRSFAAGEERLVPLSGEPLPEGWVGKTYALHRASQKARGEFILFTDADLVFEPCALRTAVYYARNKNLDLMTWMPSTRFGSFWERVVQPVVFGFIAGLTRFEKVNSPDSASAMGFGAFLFFRRGAYEAIDGHRGVKGEILEDVLLARRVKQAGLRLWVADAKPMFSLRMYHSLGEIWAGWRKNVFIALRKSILRTLGHVLGIVGFVASPYVLAGASLIAGAPLASAGLALAGLGLVVATGFGLCDELGLARRYSFLFPLGALVFAAILLNSMLGVVRGGRTQWRGRTYPA